MNPPPREESYLEHGAFLRRLARGLLYDESRADDVVQQAWLAALTKGPRAGFSARAWLGGVVRNLSRQSEREEARRRRREERAARPEAVDDESPAERLEVLRKVVVAVQELEEPYRATLLLRFFDDLSPREIAKRQGVPVDTVRTRLARGLVRLRERLEQGRDRGLSEFLGALLPLAGPVPKGLATAAAAAGGAAVDWSGAIAMGLKSSIAVAALVIAGVTLIAWNQMHAEPREPAPIVAPDPEPVVSAPDVGAPPSEPARTAEAPVAVERGPERVAAPDGEWVVSGRTVLRSGEPLPRVHLKLRLYRGPEAEGVPALEARLASDDEGRFRWPLARPDSSVTVVVHGDEPGYVSFGESAWAAKGSPPPEPFELRLYPSDSSLVGRVTDEQGRPLPHARIWTHGAKHPVDSDGRFLLEVSSDSSIGMLMADAPGYAQKRAVFEAPAAGGKSEVSIQLRPELVIRGKVRDENGALLEGVEVGTFYTSGNEVLSGRDGRFALHHLDPGRPKHMLIGEKEGMVMTTVDVQTDSRTEIEQDLVIRRGVRVEGRVLDGAGNPLEGVELYIGFSPNALGRLDAVSVSDGRFAFPAVARGDQTLVAQLPGRAPYREVLKVPQDGVLLGGVDVVLGEAHHIGGTVIDGDGDPVQGVLVSVRWHGQYLEQRGRTDAGGSFRIEGLPASALTLGFYKQRFVRQRVELDALDRDDLDVVLERAGIVAGRVVDGVTGEPLSSFTIRFKEPALEPGDQRAGGYGATWVREGHAFTDTDGYFDTGDEELAPGTVIGIEARAAGYAPTVEPRVEVLPDPDRGALVLRLHAGTKVRGRVVDAVTHEPVEGAFVKRYTQGEPLNELDSDDTHKRMQTRTDAQGGFELAAVPAGRMWLMVDHADYAPTRSEPLDLGPAGDAVEQEIGLSRGATVRGVLRGAGGEALAGAGLRMRPAYPNDSGAREASLETGADGAFRFERVGDGAWSLSLVERRGWTEVEKRSWRFSVEGGEDVRLTLEPPGTCVVEGRLRGKGDLPSDMAVTLEPLGGEEPLDRTRTASVFAEDGAFRVDGLLPGRYRATTRYSDYSTLSRWSGTAELVAEDGRAATVWIEVERSTW